MNRMLLTVPLIERERKKPPAKGATRFLWDRQVPGLAARIHPSGGVSFLIQWRERFSGAQRRLGIGTLHLWDRHTQGPAGALKEVREDASKHLADVQQGRDPALARDLEREFSGEEQKKHKFAIENVIAEFTRRHLEARDRSADYKASFAGNVRRYVLPAWAGRDIRSIARRDVIALVESVHDAGKPIQANMVLSQLGSLFSWAVDRGLIEHNPALRVRKPATARARDRVLSDSEVGALWQAAAAVPIWGNWVRWLLLTGVRRGEGARARWADLDLEAASWTLPAASTKANRAQLVPLVPEALACLPEPGPGPFIFTTAAGTPLRSFDEGKEKIDAALASAGTPLPHWTFHDLRRTMATGLAKLGTPPHVISACLNHAPAGVTAQHYNLYSYSAEKREVLAQWATHVLGLALRRASNGK
jgi:integrase